MKKPLHIYSGKAETDGVVKRTALIVAGEKTIKLTNKKAFEQLQKEFPHEERYSLVLEERRQ